MLEILGSILSGGATGLLGIGIQKFFDYKAKKLEIELNNQKFGHEVALRKIDAEIMKEEWAQRTKVAEVEANAKIEVEDSKAFAEAIKAEDRDYLQYLDKLNDKQDWVFVILEFIRGTVRPFLTLYLCLITTIIYLKCSKLLGGDIILPGMAYDLVNTIIHTILYLTTTCVLFWFGVRNNK